MSTERNEVLENLYLFIDISCADPSKFEFFRDFHVLLIKIGYNVLDVVLDYDRKRALLLAIKQELMKDTIFFSDDYFAVNLYFDELNDFLRSCVEKNTPYLLPLKKTLYTSFFKGRGKVKVAKFKPFLN